MNGAAPRHERPALTKHQQVVAQAVATILEPVLKEIDRKLDAISARTDSAIAELAATLARADEAIRQNESQAHD